jgi:CRISPR system Cascade subunit CasD
MSGQTEFLLMTLGGPMSAWGDITVGEVRSTWDRPSKSAVLGMVAAALGIGRSEAARHLELHRMLGFAVGTSDRRAASPLRDYHTAQSRSQERNADWKTRAGELNVPRHDLNTILSQRTYWQDRTAIVALWQIGKGSTDLTQIHRALQSPQYHLYLGRKSCPPGRPLAADMIRAATLEDAIKTYRGQQTALAEEHQLPDAKLAWPKFYWVDALCPGLEGVSRSEREVRRDTVRNRQYWHFSDRAEFRYGIKEDAHVSHQG